MHDQSQAVFQAHGLKRFYRMGDVTIQVAREAVAGRDVPDFVDAGTALVTPDTVGDFPHDGLFAEYRPTVVGE